MPSCSLSGPADARSRSYRALGFTSAQVVLVHLWQSVVTAVLGVVVGGSVGFVVGRAIDRQLVGNVGAMAETVLPAAAWMAAIATIAVCFGAPVGSRVRWPCAIVPGSS